MNKLYLLTIVLIVFSSVKAQDPVFNQTDNSRNYLNPAYIGTEKSFSADINYRNQWPELLGKYKTLAIQVNQFLGKGNGVSMHFVNDNAADIINKSEFGLGYAKQLNIADKHHISLGTQVSYFKKTLNWDKLTFGNMINPQTGFVNDSLNTTRMRGPRGVDFNLGVLYYNDVFFVGYSARHITQPNESFVAGVSKLPMRHNIEFGGKIKWNKVSFVPTIRYFNQGGFNTVFSLLKVKWKSLEVDGGVQFNNGVFFGAGYSSKHFNIGYNYTMSLRNQNFDASTHEIRMGCDFTMFKKENEHFFDF